MFGDDSRCVKCAQIQRKRAVDYSLRLGVKRYRYTTACVSFDCCCLVGLCVRYRECFVHATLSVYYKSLACVRYVASILHRCCSYVYDE